MKRQIKRYPNRKLYDTEKSRYVSLADVARFVRAGETVSIVDKESGEDLTAQMLTQIILDEGKKGGALIPVDVLHDVLRRSQVSLDSGMDQMRQRMDQLFQQSVARFLPFRSEEGASELDALRSRLDQLEQLLTKVKPEDKS